MFECHKGLFGSAMTKHWYKHADAHGFGAAIDILTVSFADPLHLEVRALLLESLVGRANVS